jgi:hypothetical protein
MTIRGLGNLFFSRLSLAGTHEPFLISRSSPYPRMTAAERSLDDNLVAKA